ncbi:hypothetical protein DFH07DRAFT_1059114 [Mycena maculata]|uniref:Polysaccharide lyase 14 domain-containing protein n=1 Tax=Mycena maculata TaxID=230809 RepID=A0AAD7JKT6_9AGAR|nr:hypothetical protein DFH07DRAFT_1059114 [Mycena maculata]
MGEEGQGVGQGVPIFKIIGLFANYLNNAFLATTYIDYCTCFGLPDPTVFPLRPYGVEPRPDFLYYAARFTTPSILIVEYLTCTTSALKILALLFLHLATTFSVGKGMTHNYTTAYGKQAMEAFYPKGSYIPSKKPLGGFSFYAPGPDSVDISTASELTFGYSVYFPQGFDFVKGGKLPGIYGGDNKENSTTCSGGRRDPTCFLRPAPFVPNEAICKIAHSTCNPTYGASIGRGAFRFQTGQWTTVTERLKLNTFGELQVDGALELFANGKSTLFGGATSAWASPSDQEVYFADFSMAIISTL